MATNVPRPLTAAIRARGAVPPPPPPPESHIPDPAIAGLYELAMRKAKYSHKAWIVWDDEYGGRHATRATVDSLEAAIKACGKRKFSGIGPDGCGHVLHPEMAQCWLGNARIGMLN